MPLAVIKHQPYASRLTFPFYVTTGQTIAQWQFVQFGADADTVTGTTTSTGLSIIGQITQAVASSQTGPAGTGQQFDVELRFHKANPCIATGAIAFGTVVVVSTTDGRVTAAGATPDARSVLGLSLTASVNAGDLILVGMY